MDTTEHTFHSETEARDTRRLLITSGASVSLLAYDPSREVWAFDVYA